MKEIILLSTIFCSSIFAMPKSLRLATQDWPPYQYFSNDKIIGQAVDAVSCVTKKLNLATRIEIFPWMRAQVYTEKGSVDGFFAASHSKKRDKFAIQSIPFIKQDWFFYSLKKNKLPKDINEIKKNYIVYARLNSNVHNWLVVNGFQARASFVDIKKNVELLIKGRIPLFMENSVVLNHELKRINFNKDGLNKTYNRSHHLGVYFRKEFIKQHPTFLKKFNSIASKSCSNI